MERAFRRALEKYGNRMNQSAVEHIYDKEIEGLLREDLEKRLDLPVIGHRLRVGGGNVEVYGVTRANIRDTEMWHIGIGRDTKGTFARLEFAFFFPRNMITLSTRLGDPLVGDLLKQGISMHVQRGEAPAVEGVVEKRLGKLDKKTLERVLEELEDMYAQIKLVVNGMDMGDVHRMFLQGAKNLDDIITIADALRKMVGKGVIFGQEEERTLEYDKYRMPKNVEEIVKAYVRERDIPPAEPRIVALPDKVFVEVRVNTPDGRLAFRKTKRGEEYVLEKRLDITRGNTFSWGWEKGKERGTKLGVRLPEDIRAYIYDTGKYTVLRVQGWDIKQVRRILRLLEKKVKSLTVRW